MLRHVKEQFPQIVDELVNKTKEQVLNLEIVDGVPNLFEIISDVMCALIEPINGMLRDKPDGDEYTAIRKYAFNFEDLEICGSKDLWLYLTCVVWNRTLSKIYPSIKNVYVYEGTIIDNSPLEFLPLYVFLNCTGGNTDDAVSTYITFYEIDKPRVSKFDAEREDSFNDYLANTITPDTLKEHFLLAKELGTMKMDAEYDNEETAELHDKLLRGIKKIYNTD